MKTIAPVQPSIKCCNNKVKFPPPKGLDLFSFDPTYELTSYKTWMGVIFSHITVFFLVFYVAITTRDYISRPPELVKGPTIDLPSVADELRFAVPDVSLRMLYRFVTYDDEGNRIRSAPTWLNTTNSDRYFRFSFSHRTIEEQDQLPRTTTPLTVVDCNVGNVGQELCSDPSLLVGKYLEGDYVKPKYQYLQIKLTKCVGLPECAPVEEINAILDEGEAQIQLQLRTQNYDVDQYHKGNSGIVDSNLNWRWWGIKGREIKNEMYLQPRSISQEERYAGSPPLPETLTEILAFNRLETVMQPRPDNYFEVGSWYFRLSDSVQLENVAYWSTSILDLFGLWGAMSSFLTTLSFGFVAYQYNRFMFNRHFSKSSRDSRKVAESKAKTAMNLITRTDKRSVEMYKAIRAQHDVLVVEPDVRLFDDHHFDSVGRVVVTSEELRYPSSAFGHLRKYAIKEHMKQYRAARIIGRWYVKRLMRRGKIRSSSRRLHLSQSLLRNSMANLTGRSSRLLSMKALTEQPPQRTTSLPVRRLTRMEREDDDIESVGAASAPGPMIENCDSSRDSQRPPMSDLTLAVTSIREEEDETSDSDSQLDDSARFQQ